MKKNSKKTVATPHPVRNVVLTLVILIIAGVTTFVCLNFQSVKDYIKSLSFEPSAEIAKIEEELNLTQKAKTIFAASAPELNNKDDFNAKCLSYNVEVSVLGCYANDSIHVYNIKLVELDGIKEATMAHELLHAVWARMSDNDRNKLSNDLMTVYNENTTLFEDVMEIYSEESKLNELFARVGTQVKELPERLELFYARYFRDQDQVVGYYDKYSATFKELKQKSEALSAEISALNSDIENTMSEYNSRASNLSKEISAFNNCAATAGCFTNAKFRSEHNRLTKEQLIVENLYNQIQAKIDKYNSLVAEYNNNALHTNSLNNAINSNAPPSL